jgi:membrane-anchored glycerophosphoryl diester phosphodiesterase (GDPDase)
MEILLDFILYWLTLEICRLLFQQSVKKKTPQAFIVQWKILKFVQSLNFFFEGVTAVEIKRVLILRLGGSSPSDTTVKR